MKQFKINKNNRPQPLPRAFNRVKQGSVAGQNWVLDSVRFNLTPINTQSIPNRYPTIIRTKPRGGIEGGPISHKTSVSVPLKCIGHAGNPSETGRHKAIGQSKQ